MNTHSSPSDLILDVLAHHMFNAGLDLVIVIDEHDDVVLANNAVTHTLGWVQHDLVGRNWHQFMHPKDVVAIASKINSTSLLAESSAIAVRMKRYDGDWHNLCLNTYPFGSGDHQTGSVFALRDISLEVENSQRLNSLKNDLEFSRTHDLATGLPRHHNLASLANSRSALGVERRCSAALTVIARTRQTPTNDSGVPPADVERSVAQLILSQLATDDTLARGQFGEFIVLLTEDAQSGRGIDLANRLVQRSQHDAVINQLSHHLDLSIGVAQCASGADVAEVVRHASIAANWAQLEHGTTVELFSEDRRWTDARTTAIRNQVRDALASNGFELYLQPIVPTNSPRVTALEALLRWKEDATVVPSMDAIFEAIGDHPLAVELDRYTLKWCISRYMETERLLGRDSPRMSINVCAASLCDPDFVPYIERTLRHYQADPARFCLEVTEQHELHRDGAVLERISAIQQMGVNIAIDDFGDGYSSLALLNRIDPDVIKIDRSLIADVVTDIRVGDIVRSAVNIARAVGAIVVAEGVETEEQRLWLKRNGCQSIQGYLVAKPMPWGEALAFARHSNVPQGKSIARGRVTEPTRIDAARRVNHSSRSA